MQWTRDESATKQKVMWSVQGEAGIYETELSGSFLTSTLCTLRSDSVLLVHANKLKVHCEENGKTVGEEVGSSKAAESNSAMREVLEVSVGQQEGLKIVEALSKLTPMPGTSCSADKTLRERYGQYGGWMSEHS